jgi:hypothetical protein
LKKHSKSSQRSESTLKRTKARGPVQRGAKEVLGLAQTKDELFAISGTHASDARKLYDPRGDQTLDELKQQVFADVMMSSLHGILLMRWRGREIQCGSTASPT